MTPRVLGIWLDGFEIKLADEWGLPHLAALAGRAAVATLDNGTAYLTGLTGEHLSTGLDPDAAGRASAVRFDVASYHCVQEGALHAPVIGGVPTVVFDMCYFDLDRTGPEVLGITDWGAHDPGGPPAALPASLHHEIEHRFGAYPARPWVYGTPWPSPEDCAEMGLSLTAAVEIRSRISTWLLGERCPDWQLALVGVSEAHSASEGLFHGVDPAHPLAHQPSAPAAADAMRSVYTAIDRLVGELVEAFPDAIVVVFTMHAMGTNHSDVPSMALIGELMARWNGMPTPDAAFPLDTELVPRMDPGVSWTDSVLKAVQPTGDAAVGTAGVRHRAVAFARKATRQLPAPVLDGLRRGRDLVTSSGSTTPSDLSWMPLMRHQPMWSAMKAFAVPSFYDGRIRVNLKGRESEGLVDPADYVSLLDELESILRACREPRTGAAAVSAVHRHQGDPLLLDATDADLLVDWTDGVLGLEHPEFGTIGPLPQRRSGGHTGPIGRCLVAGPGVVSGDLGMNSSFDVLPTLMQLVGAEPAWPVSGKPLHVSLSATSP